MLSSLSPTSSHSSGDISWDCLETRDDFDTGDPENKKVCESTKLVGGRLAQGDTYIVNTPMSLLVQSLIHQLCSLLEQDHKRATNLYDSLCKKLNEMKLLDKSFMMGEFEFTRSQYQSAVQHLVKVVSGNELPITQNILSSSSVAQSLSRYCREFEEIKFIANGGFGRVFMAKHRLDGMNYAIKKICIKSCDLKSILNHLSEVKTFASLDHPNIVQYKAAWLEPLLDKKLHNSVYESKKEYSSSHSSSSSYLVHAENTNANAYKSTEASDYIQFRYSKESVHVNNTNNIVVETAESCRALCKLEDSNKHMRLALVSSPLNWAMLYIQMSMCERTMKNWLENRSKIIVTDLRNPPSCSNSCLLNSTKPYMDTVINIFSQLSEGLHYIHNQGITHHDIKPSNVFISTCENDVRLGDFGLACPLQRSHNGEAIGTTLYAAPEQLNGYCNPKSDLYSIGLILMEMMEFFTTEMEKVQCFTLLRDGKIPPPVTANFPKVAHVISRLVQPKPENRIDTSDLLQVLDDLKENKDETIRLLKDEICNLKDSLREKDNEILKLKDILASR